MKKQRVSGLSGTMDLENMISVQPVDISYLQSAKRSSRKCSIALDAAQRWIM